MSRAWPDRDDGFPRAGWLISDPKNIDWAMVALFSAIALLDSTVGIGARWDEGGSWWNVAGVAASLAVLFALLGLARVVYLRRDFPRRHASIMVLTVLACVVVGTVAGRALTSALAGPDHDGPSPIGLDRMLFGTVMLVLIAWGIGSLRAFRSAANDLQAVQRQLTVAAAASEGALRAERDEIVAPIAATLRELVRALPSLSSTDASQRIRAVTGDIVRPVSHELIAATTPVDLPAPIPLPSPSWRVTLSQVAAFPLLLPKVMAATLALFVSRLSINEASGTSSIPRTPDVAVTVDLASLGRALGQLVVVFLVVWLIAVIAARVLRRVLPPRTPTVRWVIVVGSVPAVAVIAQVVILAAFTIPGLSPDTESVLRNPLLFIVPLVVIAIAAALVRTARTRGSDILSQLRTANDDLAFAVARLNEELWMQRRSLSKILHGPTQGTLNSAALRLTQATDDDSDKIRADVARRISEAVTTLESGTQEQIDVTRELALINQTWQGICDIRLDVDPSTMARVETDPLCAASFVDIIGEAIANAVIHGVAGHVTITVTEQGAREVRIDAVDDGTGPSERTSGGLGSRLLREACTDWNLSSDGTATRLFAVIPLQPRDLRGLVSADFR